MMLADILTEDNRFYQLAFSAMNSVNNDEVLLDIKTLFETSSDHIVVYRAAFLLGWLQSAESYEILKTNLSNTSPIVREASAFVLGQIAEKEMAADLLKMLRDENLDVRRMTATVIGWAGGNFHIDLMKELGLIQDTKVREEVNSILMQIGSEQALKLLNMID